MQNSKFKIQNYSFQQSAPYFFTGIKKDTREESSECKIQNYLSDVTGSLFSNPENIKAPNALKVYKAYGTNFQHSILQR